MKQMLVLSGLIMSLHAGGIWSMIKNEDLPIVKTEPYVISVKGVDIRGYTFKPKGVDMVCISVWGGDDSSHQLSCKTFKELGITHWKPNNK